MVKKVAKTKKVSSKKEDEPIQKEEKVKSLPKSKKEKKKPEKSEKVEANQEYNEESIEEEEENKEIFKIPKTRVEKAQGIVDELTSPNSNTAIYVGHLPWGFEDHALKKYFEQFGEITRYIAPRSSKTGRSVGYAFIEFKEREVAEVAAKTMNNYLLFDRILKCNVIEDKSQYDRLFLKWKKKFKFCDKLKKRLEKLSKKNKTKDEIHNKIHILLDREEKKKEMLKKLKIDYTFNGFKGIIDEYKSKNGINQTKQRKSSHSENEKARKQSADKNENKEIKETKKGKEKGDKKKKKKQIQ